MPNHSMKTRHQRQKSWPCQLGTAKIHTVSLLAVLLLSPAAWAANGTASYLDFNGATAGFGTSVGVGTISETATIWSTSSAGTVATTARPTSTQLTVGAVGTDFPGETFTITLDGGGNMNGCVVNSASAMVTLGGSGNTHFNASGMVVTVASGSTLIWNNTRSNGGNVGFNMNGKDCTFTGGGAITFITHMGAHEEAVAAGSLTNNGPTLILAYTTAGASSGTQPYSSGLTLLNGALNFQTALSADAFFYFTNGTRGLSLNGGTVDNTSGSDMTLTVGSAGYLIGGNFTFVGSSSLDFGTAPVTNTANHTVTVGANTLAIGGAISGPGNGLTKTGAGTLLLYGANTFSGSTIVNAGTLALTNGGSVASSAQVAVSNATFDLSGLTSGATSLTAYSPTNSTLTVAAVSGTVTNVMAATLNVGGTTNMVNITAIPLVTSYPATFHILKGVTVNGTLNFGLGTVPVASPAFTGYITNRAASGGVDLVLTGGPAPVRALTWSGLNGGSPNGTWDVANTPTWLDAGSAPTTFNQLDLVTFSDTATGQTTINLAPGLTPGSLTVSNNSLAYTFTGGNLSDGAGALSLNKKGTGTLLLQESGDNFTGPINVTGGTLTIDTDSSGVTGGTDIGGGAMLMLGNNDTAGVLPSGTVTVNGTLLLNRTDNINLGNTITGSGVVSLTNTSVVTLSGTSSGNWSVNIQNGTVQAANNLSLGSLPGGVVTVTNGGTFDVGGNTTQNNANFGPKQFNLAGTGVGGSGVIINSGGVQQQNAFQNVVLGGDATIGGANRWDIRGGSAILDLAGHTLTKTNANQISMVSPHVTSGNIVIGEGILSFESTPNFDASAGTITVNSGGYVGQYRDTANSFTRSIVLNGGGTTNISGNGQIAYLDAPITLTANSTLGSSGGTEIFNGVISDGGSGFSLNLVGTGTNLFTAASTFSGITAVQDTLGLTNHGSIFNSPIIMLTNGGAFDISALAGPFSGTNMLWVGDDTLGSGTFTLGKTLVTNFNYLSISNAVLQMAVVNPGAPNITVTNLNLGDGLASSTINITALPIVLPAQFPLIKYASATGTYLTPSLNLPAGFSGNLVNNTANNSIDLAITGLPAGIWNGGSATDSDWSDAANWNNTSLSGSDVLNFMGTARLNNVNDLGFTETASAINFLPGAGAFVLSGNPITLNGGITNSSSNPQTIDLGLTFGGSGTNFTFDGGSAGLIIGNGLTNAFGAPGYTTLTFAGSGTLTNLLNSSTVLGGTNIFLLNATNANWTLADNSASAPMTVPWDFQINAGTFNFGVGSSAPVLTNNSTQGLPQDNQIGNVSGAVTTLNMSNGTWTTSARLNTALANSSTGVVRQVGGTLNIGSQFQGANGGTTNAQSIVDVSGGTLNVGGGTGQFYVASRDQGSLTVSGAAAVNCGNLDLSRNANGNARGSVGVVNLNGGTVTCSRVGTATANSQAGPPSSGVLPAATFNFNGGTLRAAASATNFFQGNVASPAIPIAAVVKSGGAIIDDGGFAVTVLEPLLHDASLGTTPDGGLIKKGSGTNTLTAASTYTGNTVISNGTLVVNGSLSAASAVTVTANGTLAGSGSVGGNVTVNGTLAPGVPGTNGLLTCLAGVAFNGTNFMKLNGVTNDALVVGGNLAYGGTLNVAVLAGAPALNNSFKLFTAGSYTGNFAATNLPVLASGLAWNWNPANGTLSVVSGVNPNPTNITAVVSGGTLTLSWPADHLGWTLQCQTNALGGGLNPNAAWVDVPGSTGTDSVVITIDPAQPTVFYRMKLQ